SRSFPTTTTDCSPARLFGPPSAYPVRPQRWTGFCCCWAAHRPGRTSSVVVGPFAHDCRNATAAADFGLELGPAGLELHPDRGGRSTVDIVGFVTLSRGPRLQGRQPGGAPDDHAAPTDRQHLRLGPCL